MQTLILVHAILGSANDVARRIAELPDIESAEAVSGPYDVIVRADSASLEIVVHAIVPKIRAIRGVRDRAPLHMGRADPRIGGLGVTHTEDLRLRRARSPLAGRALQPSCQTTSQTDTKPTAQMEEATMVYAEFIGNLFQLDPRAP